MKFDERPASLVCGGPSSQGSSASLGSAIEDLLSDSRDTGASLTSVKADARFAFVEAGTPVPSLTQFSLGTQEYPDRSTTLVIEVAALDGGQPLQLTGPGIRDTATITPKGLPETFLRQWSDNREIFPRGVDVIYDNVGGKILNDMLACIATNARVVICGGISRYETGSLPAGPENYFNLVFRRGTMAGFIVLDWASEFPQIRKRLEGFVQDGRLRYQEDIQHGFENAPETLKRLFAGKNRGKQMLKL